MYPRDESEPLDRVEQQETCDFDWIDINEVRQINGGSSRSSVYEDPDLQALAVRFAEPGRRAKRVRWLRHEVRALVQHRLDRRDAEAAAVREQVIARRDRRRAKTRITARRKIERPRQDRHA